jgi:dihydrofolate reductase
MQEKNRLQFKALAAMTLDGRIARHQGEFTNWTSAEDKVHLHRELDASDAIIVGNTTFEAAHTPLSARRCIVLTRQVADTKQVNERLVYLNPENVDPVTYCQEKGYRVVAVLGGTETYTYFFNRDLIDELYLTIEPVTFGEGLPLHTATKGKRQPHLVSIEKLNSSGSLLLHYVYAS